ncbi:hypothetical protein HY523_00220, partial [Candidatus Berkelbacteria bacterium]|nr:hypothetical protein [Candidatus Berkelbacteria bacterium]
MTRPPIILQGLLVVPLLCFGLIVASPSAGAEEPSNPTATAAPPAADDSLGTDETTTTDPDEIVAGTTCEKPNLRKIEPCLNPNTTAQTWVKEIWQWSLQVVNIFAALVLIFMAFANILYPWRALEQYRIRQLLPTFIWGVILANLSLFICRAVVSVADLLMSNGAFGFNVGDIYTNVFNIDAAALDKGVVPAFFQDNVSNNPFVLLGQILVATFFIYLPIIALAILAFIFYLRFAVILFLSAISPLAFGAIIFPITRQYLSRWWDTLWKWTFGGVGSYLLILIAVKIGQASNIQNTSSAAGFTLNIIPFAIGLILVVLAIQAPFKMGGALAATWAGLGRTGLSMGIRGTKFAGTKTAEGVDRGLKIGASKWLLGAQSLEDKTKKDGGTGAFAWMNKVAANRFHGLVFRREQLEEARKARAAGHDFTISQAAGKSYIRQRRLKQFVGKNSIKALYADHEEYASKWVSPDEAATAIKDIQGNSQWLNKINKEERIAIMTKNVDGIDKMRKRLRNEHGITVSENDAAKAGTALK